VKLSVVTITFNNLDELRTTLGSLPNIPQVESVVINGGSCEKTKAYLSEHRDIVSVSEPDHGISDAFNKGYAASHGELVTFLNSGDQLIDPNYYPFAMEYLSNHPEMDFVSADITFAHPTLGKILVKPNSDVAKTPYPHPSLIVRRKVFEMVGGFDRDLKIAMDFDFMCKMVQQKFKGFYYEKNPVVLMDGSGVSSTRGFKAISERRQILNKYKLSNAHTEYYFWQLRVKMHGRNLLERAGLLKLYDHIKYMFVKPRAE